MINRLRRTLGVSGKLPQKQVPIKSNALFKSKMEHNDLGRYKSLVGSEKDKTFIICGCGTSINNFTPDGKSILFGVNDINRKLQTKYLICVNEPHTFKRGRFEWVQNHTSEYFFTHLRNLSPVKHEATVYFDLGTRDGAGIDNIGEIDYTTNSPYMAVIIAYQLGATKIGLIGIDLTPDHFFDKTGDHLLTSRYDAVNEEYRKLAAALLSKGVKVANLSNISRVTSWPYMSHEDFNNF